jgi:glycosyltransferase involved in cell wall biosynthesis
MLRRSIVLLGPSLQAASGVSTHLNNLLGSPLAREFDLRHFQVGSEGRTERRWQRMLRFAWSPFTFALYLLAHRPSIVQLNTSLEPKSYWRDVVYLVIARLLRRRVVYQVHGGALPRDFFGDSPFLTAILRRVLTLPQAIVVLAQTELLAYRDFLPSVRLLMIPNAISFNEANEEPLNAPGSAALRLVYVGRLARDKGLFEFVEAVEILRERGVRVHAVIAGTGPDEDQLREAVTRAGLDEWIALPGALFGAQKARLWGAADIFVFPTYHREGLPYALLESMAAGAVPITTRTGAIPDVIREDVHGLFVPPKDPLALANAISRLNDDRDALARMASAGRERVRTQYTLDRLATDFQVLYSSL